MDFISEASDSKILAAALLSDLTIVTLSSHSAKSNIARQLTLITIDYAWKTFNVGQAIVFNNQVDSDLTEHELPPMEYKLSVVESADTVYFWFTQQTSTESRKLNRATHELYPEEAASDAQDGRNKQI